MLVEWSRVPHITVPLTSKQIFLEPLRYLTSYVDALNCYKEIKESFFTSKALKPLANLKHPTNHIP